MKTLNLGSVSVTRWSKLVAGSFSPINIAWHFWVVSPPFKKRLCHGNRDESNWYDWKGEITGDLTGCCFVAKLQQRFPSWHSDSQLQQPHTLHPMAKLSSNQRTKTIDRHVRWNINCWLSFIICWPRKTYFWFSISVCIKQTEVCHFHFSFAANSGSCHFPLLSLFNYIYIYTVHKIYTYVLVLFSYEERKWRPRWFSLTCLPFAHHADRRKLSIWKWTKRTKQTYLPIYANDLQQEVLQMCGLCKHMM